MIMNAKLLRWTFLLLVLIATFCLLAAPFLAFGQAAGEAANESSGVTASEENILALLKAMFFQVLNSPGSLLVILGLSIISTSLEMLIRAVDWVSNKLIFPLALCLCVFGGAFSYWMFSATSSVDKAFPHPHAVLFVNGLICGVAAFVIHIWLVKFLVSKQDKQPKPPEV